MPPVWFSPGMGVYTARGCWAAADPRWAAASGLPGRYLGNIQSKLSCCHGNKIVIGIINKCLFKNN